MGQFRLWDCFKSSFQSVHGFLFTIVAASEQYQAGSIQLCQCQESRIVQIGGYYNPLPVTSPLQNLAIRCLGKS